MSESARRGFQPADRREFGEEALPKLRTAARHISYLLDEGYGMKQASVFVGNHFLLSGRQRLALMRSLASTSQLIERKKKELEPEDMQGREVYIDGFNIMITLEIALLDATLLMGKDGCVRDLAGLRGTYRIIEVTRQAAELLQKTLQELKIARANVLLDAPVSNSGRLKTLLAETHEGGFELDISLENKVDALLQGRENVISADSGVLDDCVSWFNLVPLCLERAGRSELPVQVW
ncbi:MAG: DUF434 domain-containing protein [Anaerovoracaceae bacterium]|jgi:hypothetical protein